MKSMKFLLGAALLLSTTLFFTNCTKDDDGSSATGTTQIEITDGPVDDTNVKGTFVTITAVKVDGKAISGFTKQTIDLMAYQQGNTKILGTTDLETGTYSDVSFVLDYQTDANGNAPGCYVLTTDNVKHNLQASSSASNEVPVNTGSFDVQENVTTHIVFDFDLRKSVRYEDSPQAGDQYDFVVDAELRNAVRLVTKEKTGKVDGDVTDDLGIAGDKIIVFAYKKGTYNKAAELEGEGEGNLQFNKAVTSAVVNSQGEYTLAFLEAGDYEVHFFGFEDGDSDGKLDVKGELQLNLLTNLGLDLNNINLEANTTISVSVEVLGLVP